MGPSLLQLSTIWLLPESPRWLISKDRDDEALAALKQYHGEGKETELVRLEFEEIRNAIDHEKRTYCTSARILDVQTNSSQLPARQPGSRWSAPPETATACSSSYAWAS